MNEEERDEIKRLTLKEILKSKHGLQFNKHGFASCPFHKNGQEQTPSLKARQEGDYWRWHCFSCRKDGDYIDFRMSLDNTDFITAKKNIQLEFGLNSRTKTQSKNSHNNPIAIYLYKDQNEKPLYRKLKFSDGGYSQERFENGKWKRGLNNTGKILYNLPELLESNHVFYLEGEKDCETLRGLEFVATTAGSVNDWKEKFVTFFKEKEVNISLDVGNEDIAERIANDLSEVTDRIKILMLPGLTEREQDITDWIEMLGDISGDQKKERLKAIVEETPYFEPKQRCENKLKNEFSKFEVMSAKEFREQKFPAREIFMECWLEKEALTILAGEKKMGKSLLSLNISLKLAWGQDFLDFEVPKPRTVLLFQQEIPRAAMGERLDKMLINENTPTNLHLATLTEGPIKITNSQDREHIFKAIDFYKPDLVILDPLSTFHNRQENDSTEMSEVFNYFYEIINKFKVGILIIHHFSKPSIVAKYGADNVRGSTVITDRPDAIITLHKLPQKYEQSSMPLPYKNYAEVQFTLRNSEEPERILIERNRETLWYEMSNLYSEYLGKKILPEEVRRIVKDHEGVIRQKQLMDILQEKASYKVAHKAIKEAEEKGYIELDPLTEPGKPNLIRLKNWSLN